ncbi:hypothetical protein GJU03_02230 (plasmid) [Enterobacteriaceae endosymbiont of Donacia bicoloricornis]|uniref:prephenate dehydratase domain-containing protein n=1 Tax=Enterobacteriaceae endosymbiont of Donacia bicoloricornis TaxID=2675772 RepID=UPI0014496B0D|nr:prephenate dehydratase domain-containing protein [Enterobacteriaceae endosymbiont of Donacia bicoloricornis]QJC37954.1 hypothetical protein GJU03_02230 [Enterobacteriaceae endosymbiont of Donacia bicoloricornis]
MSKITHNNIIINDTIDNFIKKRTFQKNITKKKYYKSIIFLGPIGSYSHLATLFYIKKNFFQKTVINISCHNFKEIFYYINNKHINLAIVPIYNNNTGLIKEVFILLKQNYSLFIKNKFFVPIQHCLVSFKKNLVLNKIKKILSHIEPLKQCSIFIKKHPHWELQHCSSSSLAMKLIKINQSKKLAAIGNKISAKLHNLHILKNKISNTVNNQTKFLVLEKNYYYNFIKK